MDHVEFAKFAVKNNLRSKTSLLAYLKQNNSDEVVKAAENYCFRFSNQLESRLSFAWEWEDAPERTKLTRPVLGTWLCKRPAMIAFVVASFQSFWKAIYIFNAMISLFS